MNVSFLFYRPQKYIFFVYFSYYFYLITRQLFRKKNEKLMIFLDEIIYTILCPSFLQVILHTGFVEPAGCLPN